MGFCRQKQWGKICRCFHWSTKKVKVAVNFNGKGIASLKNAVPSPLECAIDVYNIATNYLLKIPISEYKESLKEEGKVKQV